MLINFISLRKISLAIISNLSLCKINQTVDLKYKITVNNSCKLNYFMWFCFISIKITSEIYANEVEQFKTRKVFKIFVVRMSNFGNFCREI